MLLLTVGLFVKAQDDTSTDLIILKTGEEYKGQIIEQIPGKSVKLFRPAQRDTLTLYLAQVEKLKKLNTDKKEKVKPEREDERNVNININTTDVPPPVRIPNQTGNDITIFNEHGYRFAVYINGERYGEDFSTSTQISNINHNWIKLGVLFENPDYGVLERNVVLSSNDNMIPYNSSFEIVVSKNNRFKLRYRDRSMKKVEPGTGNVLIHQHDFPASGVHFKSRISR